MQEDAPFPFLAWAALLLLSAGIAGLLVVAVAEVDLGLPYNSVLSAPAPAAMWIQIALAGLLGGILHVLWDLSYHAFRKKDHDPRVVVWYVARIVQAPLVSVFVFATFAGLAAAVLVDGSFSAPLSPTLLAIAFLCGNFSHELTQALQGWTLRLLGRPTGTLVAVSMRTPTTVPSPAEPGSKGADTSVATRVLVLRDAREGAFAAALADNLEAWGSGPVVVQPALHAGSPAEDAAAAALKDCSAIILVVSPAHDDVWHQREGRLLLSKAVQFRIPIIPVLPPGAPVPEDLPDYLGRPLFVKFNHAQDPDALSRVESALAETLQGTSRSLLRKEVAR